MRRCLALLLALAVAPVIWLRAPLPAPDIDQGLVFTPIALPPPSVLAANLGPFRLEGAWRMDSAYPDFGGFSTLVRTGEGKFTAFSDKGYALRFSAPGMDQRDTRLMPFTGNSLHKWRRDAEGAAFDPLTGRTWITWEGSNAISRLSPTLQPEAIVRPAAMKDWGDNSGPETIVRLADGRLLVLREGFSGRFEAERHKALIFVGDPTDSGEPEEFTFAGPARFSPSDAVQLPDGRVLILLRRLVWPLPFRFAGRLAIADPDEIRAGGDWRAREVAKLTSSLPVDNFEGIAIEPGPGDHVSVWLVSDDNDAATQATILWKLVVDPARLP